MRTWMTLMTTALALFIGTNAAAGEFDEPPLLDEEVSLEEAEEFAELVDTYKTPDGVEMEVYLDEAQGLMWEQPADAGEAGIRDDRIFYMVPHWLYFKDDEGYWDYFYRSTGEITYIGNCMGGSPYCTKWKAWGTGPWQNVQTVLGLGYSYTTNWTADYEGQYWDLDGPDITWIQSTTDTTFVQGGSYYYKSYEWADPDGGVLWYYANTRAIRFIYYDSISGYYRYVEVWYDLIE